MRNGKIRIGIMGLGQIGRHLYHLALEKDDIEIVAVADIGNRKSSSTCSKATALRSRPASSGQLSVNEKFRTRMLQLARPEEFRGIFERGLRRRCHGPISASAGY